MLSTAPVIPYKPPGHLQGGVHTGQPFYLRVFLKVGWIFSTSLARLHYGMIAISLLKPPAHLLNDRRSFFENLHEIWYARIVRRALSFLLRTPFRKSTLRLIEFTVPIPPDSGCIIAICHTPWKRLLVQWCLENRFGLIISEGKWTQRKRRIQREGSGVTELRKIVKHLQQNGRVILAADVFNNKNNCPVKFMGNEQNASTVHVRLARLAGVPLLTVIPSLNQTSVNFTLGPRFESLDFTTANQQIVQDIFHFFEDEIRDKPSIWSPYAN